LGGTQVRTNYAVVGFPAFDSRGAIDGAYLADSIQYGVRVRRAVIGIRLEQVKAVRFPIFMQAQAKIEIRLAFQPCDVRNRFGRRRLAVLPVQIDPGGIFTPVQRKTAWV